MENNLALSFLIVGITSLFIFFKSNNEKGVFVNLLFFVLLLIGSLAGFSKQEDGENLIPFLIVISVANWLLSRVFHLKKLQIIGVISSISVLYFANTNYTFLEFPVIFTKENVLFLPLIASLVPFLITNVFNFLRRKTKTNLEKTELAIHYISLGILALIGSFFGGAFGLFLLAFGYFISEVYTKSTKFSMLLITIAFANLLVKNYAFEINNVFQASLLLGFFIGIGLIYLFVNLEKETKFWVFLVQLLGVSLVLFSLINVESIKEHLGGFGAMIGLILAFVSQNEKLLPTVNGEPRNKQLLWIYLVSFTFGITILFGNQINKQKSTKLQTKVINEKFKEEESIDLSEIADTLPIKSVVQKENQNKKDSILPKNSILGEWKINSKASKLTFELGSTESLTKGEFQEINGSFLLSENSKKNKVKVDLPLKGFTTYNDYRDESLMESGFLDAGKQAVLTFDSEKWLTKKSSNFITGNFKMKGVSQPLQIELKIVGQGKDENGDYLLIKGSSSLDRTKFEMTSDPKIGDLVSFQFQLELRK